MRACLISAFSVALCALGQAQTPATLGTIERLDPALDEMLPVDAKIEVLSGGFTWVEGPVFVEDDGGGHVLFSDIPRNSIFKWSEARGIELFMKPAGYTGNTFYGKEPGTNGLALDGQGRLTCCEHGDRRVSVLTRGGGKLTLADRYQGRRLNSPNDLVFDSDGCIYFTDPPYGLPERYADPRRELDFCGVYRLDPDLTLTLLSKQLARPNGIGLSPDQKTLYVAQSDLTQPIWMAFPIKEDKTLGEGNVLFDCSEFVNDAPGAPDGMAVAPNGWIFGSGPGGVYVITPEGKLLGRLFTGGRVSNCGFDRTAKTLYITADTMLARVKMK